MVEVEDGRIYEVLNPRDPPSWNATKGVQRSKTVGAIPSGHKAQNGFANYAVPRYVHVSCTLTTYNTAYRKSQASIIIFSDSLGYAIIKCMKSVHGSRVVLSFVQKVFHA